MSYQIIFQSKSLYDCNNIFIWNFLEPITVFYIIALSSRSGADIEVEDSACNLLQTFSK
jgi:hypothetical protein